MELLNGNFGTELRPFFFFEYSYNDFYFLNIVKLCSMLCNGGNIIVSFDELL